VSPECASSWNFRAELPSTPLSRRWVNKPPINAPVRFHGLRHTCATLLLAKGVHSKFVQALLGHVRISVTMDLYSHWASAIGNQTAAAMEDALREHIEVAGEGSEIGAA
jgi:integrase